MAGNVEGQGALEHSGTIQRALLPRFSQLLEGLVGAVDIGLVMLAVMQLHDARRDMRLQGVVVVGKIGQYVLGHGRLRFNRWVLFVGVQIIRRSQLPVTARYPTIRSDASTVVRHGAVPPHGAAPALVAADAVPVAPSGPL